MRVFTSQKIANMQRLLVRLSVDWLIGVLRLFEQFFSYITSFAGGPVLLVSYPDTSQPVVMLTLSNPERQGGQPLLPFLKSLVHLSNLYQTSTWEQYDINIITVKNIMKLTIWAEGDWIVSVIGTLYERNGILRSKQNNHNDCKNPIIERLQQLSDNYFTKLFH